MRISDLEFRRVLFRSKEWWLDKLAELYELVNKSLGDYVKSGDVSISRSPVTLHEEQLGSYQVDQLEILLGRQIVRLKPIGTFLIGARGRVDMVGPRGSVRFVIVPPASQKPSIEITVSIGEDATDRKNTRLNYNHSCAYRMPT